MRLFVAVILSRLASPGSLEVQVVQGALNASPVLNA